LKWDPPLTEAILLKRYKRFLADVKLGQDHVTVHVPNTGSMTGCWESNWKCALSKSDNPKRKMPHTLELTHNGETWIGVNAANANKLAHLWLKQNLIPELAGYQTIRPEKKIGESRIDFYLDDHPSQAPCYVEVKSVTLKLDDMAQFPDAVSVRGQKHLKELMNLKKEGFRAVMLYVVQREDVSAMKAAASIDSKYACLLKEAHEAGVEIFVYQCKMERTAITFGQALPFYLE
jgi:sugar fermentation stimulation protein A